MDAKKCDRCRKFYLPNKESGACDAIQKYKRFGCCDTEKIYDICPECMESFERWVSYDNHCGG